MAEDLQLQPASLCYNVKCLKNMLKEVIMANFNLPFQHSLERWMKNINVFTQYSKSFGRNSSMKQEAYHYIVVCSTTNQENH
jgi:hypothetical protein